MRISSRLLVAISLLSLLILPSLGNTATVLALSLEDLTKRSNIVVRGVATGIETHRDERGLIVRSVSYRVSDYIAGKGLKEITVRLQGGELDGLGRMIPGEVNLKVGDETLLFLEKMGNQESTFRIVGLSQGRFYVLKDSKIDNLFVSRPTGDINLVGNPTNDSHNLGQNKTSISIWLSEFVAAVRKIK